jgi:carbon-monoxide dehydrogenase iron sulfur subunit
MDTILVLWERCNACGDCLTACTDEMARLNQPLPSVPRLTIHGKERPAYVALCRHCAEAPCRDACISGAITVSGGGRVELADETCVQCCMCLAHCPFGALTLTDDHVVKCDICTPIGTQPPCVRACGEGALLVGGAQRMSRDRARERARHQLAARLPGGPTVPEETVSGRVPEGPGQSI